jgi:DHA1 family tetracycline resistance protein-like MFS transporter
MPPPPRPGSPRAILIFLAASLVLDALAQSISFPILPRLAQSLTGGDAAGAARWVGWLEVSWAIPQFLAAPVLGALSDRFGRRPVIVLSMLGVGLELILNALAPNIGWLVAGRIFCGIFCSGYAAVMAYVADVTAPEDRAGAYGWMSAAPWLGIILGPAGGGLLAGIDLRAPFWAAAAVALAASAYGALVLPESPRERSGAPLRLASLNPWRAVDLLARPGLNLLALALLLVWLAFQGRDNMLVLYTAVRYRWTPLDFGLFATALAAASIAVQGGLAGRVTRRLGERATVLGGLLLQALGMVGMGLAGGGALFCVANLPAVLGALATPALQSMMSRRVGPDDQGRLQGAIGSVASFTSIVAPVAFTQLFAWTIAAGRGLAWSGMTMLVGAALSLAACALVAITRPTRTRS